MLNNHKKVIILLLNNFSPPLSQLRDELGSRREAVAVSLTERPQKIALTTYSLKKIKKFSLRRK